MKELHHHAATEEATVIHKQRRQFLRMTLREVRIQYPCPSPEYCYDWVKLYIIIMPQPVRKGILYIS